MTTSTPVAVAVAVAVLDDYQGVARSLGPWERVLSVRARRRRRA